MQELDSYYKSYIAEHIAERKRISRRYSDYTPETNTSKTEYTPETNTSKTMGDLKMEDKIINNCWFSIWKLQFNYNRQSRPKTRGRIKSLQNKVHFYR